jgi:hypothetical protein
MDETKRAWDEVGEGFAKLGRFISERHKNLGEEGASRPSIAEEGAVADAIRRATDELDRAFTSLGDTFRDDEAREHARDTGRKLSEALRVTFSTISEQVGRTIGSHPPPGRSQPPPPEPPTDSGTSA